MKDFNSNPPTFCWQEADEFVEDMVKASCAGKEYFYQTYIPLFDYHVSNINYSSLMCIGARPGHGKSAFALYLAYSRLKNCPSETILFFSLEMSKKEVHRRFFSMLTEIDPSEMSKQLSEEITDIKIPKYLEEIKKYNIIFECIEYREIEKIKARIKEVAKLYPLKTVIIDYLQIVKGSKGSSKELRYMQIGDITKELKIISMEVECVIVCLCQFARKVEDRQNEKNFKTVASDLRESGDIEADADIVIGMHKKNNFDRQTAKVQFDVLKNRHGSSGSEFYLEFKLPFSKFL